MKIALGSDHRGCSVVERISAFLKKQGHSIERLGEVSCESSDYPDAAYLVGTAIRTGQADRGVLVCGSGIGMSIAANKINGVRAALVHDELSARMSRAHNNSNVLCLSADLLGATTPERILESWLSTEFEGGRHARRVEKIARIEAGEPL
jgi:ribose 5-phosphate isomerase B